MHNYLPGVPHVESPFFADIFNAANIDPVTRRIALDLATNGYAIIDFPDPDFAAVASAIQAGLGERFDLANWRAEGHRTGASPRLRDAWQYDANVLRLATNPAVLGLLQRLYGRRALPFQTLNFPVGTQQHFHSDTAHFNSCPERFMCGVWVALEDVDESNGPLLYFPGSHRWPIYGNEHLGICAARMDDAPTQASYEPMWRALVAAHGAKPATLHVKKGQAVIWAANLMHGGAPHLDPDRTRWTQVTHYFFDDCAYFTQLHSDPVYGSIAFRKLHNLATGEPLGQHYAGHAIPEEHIRASVPPTMRWLETFDKQLYLQANPDVAAAGVDAVEHYWLHGRKENRKLRP